MGGVLAAFRYQWEARADWLQLGSRRSATGSRFGCRCSWALAWCCTFHSAWSRSGGRVPRSRCRRLLPLGWRQPRFGRCCCRSRPRRSALPRPSSPRLVPCRLRRCRASPSSSPARCEGSSCCRSGDGSRSKRHGWATTRRWPAGCGFVCATTIRPRSRPATGCGCVRWSARPLGRPTLADGTCNAPRSTTGWPGRALPWAMPNGWGRRLRADPDDGCSGCATRSRRGPWPPFRVRPARSPRPCSPA